MDRFPPEAFPKGTIVKWQVFDCEEPKECEVEYVVEQGYDNYLIKFVTPDQASDELNFLNVFNIYYVIQIVKRGSGPMIIKQGLPTTIKEGNSTSLLKNILNLSSSKKGRRKVIPWHLLEDYADWYLQSQYGRGHFFNFKRLEVLIKNSNMKASRKFVSSCGACVSVKYFQRWLKRNVNRLLISKKELLTFENENYENECQFEGWSDSMSDGMVDVTFSFDYENFHKGDTLLPFTVEGLFNARETSKHYKGVLTDDELLAKIAKGSKVIMEKTYRDVKNNKTYYFFTDEYLFGYAPEKEGSLPEDFVSSSTAFPLYVVPRPGVEDGWVDTLDKYRTVFLSDKIQITSLEDLVKLLNQNFR